MLSINRLKTRLYITVFLSLYTFASSHATDDAKILVEKLSLVQSLSGLFTQHTYTNLDELISKANGKFSLQVPNKLNWQTFDPFPQSLISDGKTMWLYDPDLEQVTVSKITDQLENTPAIIFSGDFISLEKKYTVTQLNQNQFQLTPIADESLFKFIRIGFDHEQLVSLEMFDQMAQKTIYSFSETSVSVIDDESVFEFLPPEGVDVLIND
jgi:outer membrane lipoprotein carrier protein